MNNDVIIEILDKSLNLITTVNSLMPMNNGGEVLQYSKELSDYGKCTFRVSAYDTMLDTYGDILQPHKNHVRIRIGETVLWHGIIIENAHRNKSYIDVLAVEYEFYLDKILVKRTSPDENGNTDIYRIFSSGTMDAAITAIMNETIARFASTSHPLSGMTLGTIENPNYPPNMTTEYTSGGTISLTGPWLFGDGGSVNTGPEYRFDFQSILYVLKCFGIQTYADFMIDKDLKFQFKKFIGNANNKNLVFKYGPHGNIVDYNLCRLGQRMVNYLYNEASDNNGVILQQPTSDQDSINTYGLMEGVAAYTDVKSQSALTQRGNAVMPMIATPDETNAIVYVDEKNIPFSNYSIGDLITIQIKNKGVDFDQVRRIVGITVILNETGRQMVAIQTNIPQDFQLNGGA